MLSWHDILAHQERYKDRLREAQSNQLVLHELDLRESKDRFHCRVLTWLGRGLVAWGWRLQERYGTMVGVPTLRAADCTQRADKQRCL
jgi:hypothetical protein